MKTNIDISSPEVWMSILTPEEYAKVGAIIESMQCDPKPTVLEFLRVIRNAVEAELLPRKAVS